MANGVRAREDGTQRPDAYGWITALRAPAIKKLMADDGPLQLSLFDQQDLAEITSDDFPGERLVACRNPVLAADRARTPQRAAGRHRETPGPHHRPRPGRETHRRRPDRHRGGQGNQQVQDRQALPITITHDTLAVTRKQDQINAEAALDGFYVLRTPIPAAELDGPGVVTAYKNLKYVERDFRSIKSDDLNLRPIWHRLEERVKAHVLICMLACYLT